MKLTAHFKFKKALKTLAASGKTKTERDMWKKALQQAVATTQDKNFSGRYVMNYEISPSGKRKKENKE